MGRIGVLSDSFRLGILPGLNAAKGVSADAVQVYIGERGAATTVWTHSLRREVMGRLNDLKLSISAMCCDIDGHGFTRADENPWKIDEMRARMELTRELNGTVITGHIGVIPNDVACEKYAVIQSAMGAVSEIGDAMDCMFAIETGPEHPETLKTFIDSLPGSGVKVNYDPANLIMVLGIDPVAGVKTLGDRIVHTHAKDGKMLKYLGAEKIYGFFAEGGIGDLRMEEYFLETPLGEGDVDWSAYIAALEEIGYTGYLTIEREVGENPARDITNAVEFLRKLGV